MGGCRSGPLDLCKLGNIAWSQSLDTTDWAQPGQLQGRGLGLDSLLGNGNPGIRAGPGCLSSLGGPRPSQWHLSLPGCLSNVFLLHRGGREA